MSERAAGRRRWTAEDDELLRREYRRVPAAVLGCLLGRTPAAVCQHATRLGLQTPRPVCSRAWLQQIRDRHTCEWSDAEIAEHLGVDRKTIEHWRRKMGLPANRNSRRRRARVAARTREQCQRAGVSSLAEIRRLTFRRRAREAGWPEDLRPRAVQILNLLWDAGPQTRREIARQIGTPWKGSRKSLRSNDPEGSYLAHLIARGLVIDLGRIHRGNGPGHSTHVYSLALDVERHTQWEDRRPT